MTYQESKEKLKSDLLLKESIKNLIHHCLKFKTTTFKIQLVNNKEHLLKNSVLQKIPSDNNLIKINEYSLLFQGVLKEVAEDKLKNDIPTDIIDSLIFIEEFGEEIRKPHHNIHWSGYGDLIRGLEQYSLLHLFFEFNIDILSFYNDLPENHINRKHKILYSFERIFFNVLPYLDLSTTTLFNFILKSISFKKNLDGIMDFARKYPTIFPEKGIDLLDFGLKKNFLEIENLCFSLLVGLHKSNPTLAIQKTKKIFTINQVEALTAAARFDYNSENEILELYELIEKINLENQKAFNQLSYFLMRIINSKKASDTLIKNSLAKFKVLIKDGDNNLKNVLIFDISRVEGYEEERFTLLLEAFNNGLNLNVIERFFYNFNNPKFFFHLFKSLLSQVGIKLNMDLFKEGLWILWKNNQRSTEKEILILLGDDNALVRYGGVKMLTASHHPLPVNLNLIKSARKQCNAIEALLNYPTMLDELLKIVLVYRNSKFSSVSKRLQDKLCDLVDAYPHHLLESINKALMKDNTKEVNDFLNPIRIRVAQYNHLMQERSKIKELDPYENEIEYLDYYYNLEHEKNQEMMAGIGEDKNSFLSNFSKNIVVRGTAFKSEDSEEIIPLAKISHSIPIDQRAYKNPDLYQTMFEDLITGTSKTLKE